MTASLRSSLGTSYYYGSATLTLAKPSGAVEGDILIAVMLNNDSTRTLDTYTGWTLLRNSEQATPTSVEQWVLSKKLGASEPASYDFIFNYAFNGAANVLCWQDGDEVDVDGAAAVSAVQTGPYASTAPTITTTVDDCLLVSIHGAMVTTSGVTPAFTPPSGYSSVFEAKWDSDARMFAVSTKTLATAGASGTAAGSWAVTGGGDGRATAVHLAISPAVTSYVARPDSDVTAGAWTASTGSVLYAMIDEETASDTDYITSSSASTVEIGLSSITTPPSGWITTVRYRILGDCTVSLREGASTEIASWPHSPGPGSATTYEQELTSGQQSSVTDWADLRLRIVKP